MSLDSKKNQELLQEIFWVTYHQKVPGWHEFAPLVNALNQGASLEGIYNGLIHAKSYSHLEEAPLSAGIRSIDLFADELARLERELPQRTLFFSEANLPDFADETKRAPAGQDASAIVPRQKVREVGLGLAKNHYVSLFGRSSVYLLKRVLGEEAIRVINAKSENPPDLAQWYGELAARLALKGVDFGLPKRNERAVQFHVNWAAQNTRDLLTWEVLNRYHRLLNDAEEPFAEVN